MIAARTMIILDPSLNGLFRHRKGPIDMHVPSPHSARLRCWLGVAALAALGLATFPTAAQAQSVSLQQSSRQLAVAYAMASPVVDNDPGAFNQSLNGDDGTGSTASGSQSTNISGTSSAIDVTGSFASAIASSGGEQQYNSVQNDLNIQFLVNADTFYSLSGITMTTSGPAGAQVTLRDVSTGENISFFDGDQSFNESGILAPGQYIFDSSAPLAADEFDTYDYSSEVNNLKFHVGAAPVPEASTMVSFGLLLALGMSGLLLARKRQRTAARRSNLLGTRWWAA